MYTGLYLRLVKQLHELFERNKHVFLFNKINEIHEFHKKKIDKVVLMKDFYNKTKPRFTRVFNYCPVEKFRELFIR